MCLIHLYTRNTLWKSTLCPPHSPPPSPPSSELLSVFHNERQQGRPGTCVHGDTRERAPWAYAPTWKTDRPGYRPTEYRLSALEEEADEDADKVCVSVFVKYTKHRISLRVTSA